MVKKVSIPKRVREMVWKTYIGKKWRGKCFVSWCDNKFSVLSSWHVGHNKPESKGGDLSIENLRPICADCNLGMNNKYSIEEWCSIFDKEYKNTFKAAKILEQILHNKKLSATEVENKCS